MAVARLALKNLQQKGSCCAWLLARAPSETQFVRGISSAVEEKAEVAVQDASNRRRGRDLWRRRDALPALWDMFPRGLGDALVEATENMNRMVENIAGRQLVGRAREHDDSYTLRYEMPGLGKEEVKITVEDGVLRIRGEHSSSSTYGYYNTSLVLPEDAKLDQIKAEMKDGVLNILIPKAHNPNKDVKEVEVY